MGCYAPTQGLLETWSTHGVWGGLGLQVFAQGGGLGIVGRGLQAYRALGERSRVQVFDSGLGLSANVFGFSAWGSGMES